jgi:flagellar protein FliT
MMTPSLMDYYKAIEDSSLRMLAAAEQEDWDQVVRLEGVCAVLIEQLRVKSRGHSLDAHERREKSTIMQRILANDAMIRCLAEPWLTYIDKSLEQGNTAVLH